MNNLLIVVDMQNDFIDGSLGTKEAQSIIKNVVNKIQKFDGKIIATADTHSDNYLDTAEGEKLPVKHCIKGTTGWMINSDVEAELNNKGFYLVEKNTFGSIDLPQIISESSNDGISSIEIIGLCTDICVVSNALILKAYYPELPVSVDASCCAGVTPETHNAALSTMRMCQIDIING